MLKVTQLINSDTRLLVLYSCVTNDPIFGAYNTLHFSIDQKSGHNRTEFSAQAEIKLDRIQSHLRCGASSKPTDYW